MKTTITNTSLFAAVLAMTMQALTACAQTAKPQTDRELRGRGMIIEFGWPVAQTQKKEWEPLVMRAMIYIAATFISRASGTYFPSEPARTCRSLAGSK